jgi:hypothetical protein
VKQSLLSFSFSVLVIVPSLSASQVFADVKTPQEQENTYEPVVHDGVVPEKPKACDSFKEFQTAYEAFLKDTDLALNEEKSARLALQISQGCLGSAARFRKAYEMMKKTGVALTKAVEIALDFAVLDDERLKNFNEVFAKMYLENVYDFDFPTAYKVSFALSKDYEGRAKDVRDDFNKLVKFCIANDKVALPLRQCAEFALTLVEHTPKFPGGLFSEFEKFYVFLRTDKRMGLSILEALNLVPKVLAYGPKASVNFQKGVEYSLSSNKITINHKNAINLGLRLAQQTLPPEVPESTHGTAAKK